MTSEITEFNSPTYFVDEQVSGAFKYFKHEHIFERQVEQTLMIDRFDFESPFGIFGRLVNVLFLKKYITNLLVIRNQFIKQKAEKINSYT